MLSVTGRRRGLTLDDVGKTNGSYHEVVMLEVSRNHQTDDYVIRVSAHDTLKFWTEKDDYTMQCEVELMMPLHKTTKVPVPEVLDFATVIVEGIGFPYIGTYAKATWKSSLGHVVGQIPRLRPRNGSHVRGPSNTRRLKPSASPFCAL